MKKTKMRQISKEVALRGDIWTPDPIITDPMGSYTGRPLDRDDIPVQDADDL